MELETNSSARQRCAEREAVGGCLAYALPAPRTSRSASEAQEEGEGGGHTEALPVGESEDHDGHSKVHEPPDQPRPVAHGDKKPPTARPAHSDAPAENRVAANGLLAGPARLGHRDDLRGELPHVQERVEDADRHEHQDQRGRRHGGAHRPWVDQQREGHKQHCCGGRADDETQPSLHQEEHLIRVVSVPERLVSAPPDDRECAHGAIENGQLVHGGRDEEHLLGAPDGHLRASALALHDVGENVLQDLYEEQPAHPGFDLVYEGEAPRKDHVGVQENPEERRTGAPEIGDVVQHHDAPDDGSRAEHTPHELEEHEVHEDNRGPNHGALACVDGRASGVLHPV
mmetsp:Transcript_116807/g.325484  ORF Transcript_116807/g.325484 Transcript_116807/m.325484 type:complete len:343 (-) Transcript_116807:2783-3811(-)